MRARLALPTLILAGCMVHERDEDDVWLCIGDHWQVDEVEILAGEPLEMGFTSTQCGDLVEAWCELEVVGDTIYATTYQETKHHWASVECTTMVKYMDVFCETPTLDAGTYLIDYGGPNGTIEVPSTVEPYCIPPG